MKKIVLFVLLSLLPLIAVHAQISGRSSSPDLEVSIRRVTDLGNGTFRLNLFVTNHGKEDLNRVFINAVDYNSNQRTQAYDDEGNTYGINSFVFTVAGESNTYSPRWSCPRKSPSRSSSTFMMWMNSRRSSSALTLS